jgi:thioredoxin reductase
MTVKQCVAILGAGPAGLSAALWLHNLGFEPRVFETNERAGGLQNLNFLANDWVLGQVGRLGPELAAHFVEHVRGAGIGIVTGARPMRLEGAAGAFRLHLSDASTLDCIAVVIATGTRYRAGEVLAGVAGIDELPSGRIAYGPYAFADLDACTGKSVLVVGGGDNAFENVRLLAPRAAQLYLAVRSEPRAQQGLAAIVAEAESAGRCRTFRPARIEAVVMDSAKLAVTLTGDISIAVDRIHVLAGYEPNTSFLHELLTPESHAALRFDEQGYLKIDDAGRCGTPGMYAAGDVCNPRFPSVVSAIAQGAVAARTIELDNRTS